MLDILLHCKNARIDYWAVDESRSNVRFPGASRTINHPELADVIGTGFICG